MGRLRLRPDNVGGLADLGDDTAGGGGGGEGREVPAPGPRPRLHQHSVRWAVVRGGEVPDSGRGNLPAGHRLHHRNLPALPHGPGWRGHWIFQSEARALRVLVQRHGNTGSDGAPGSFLANSQIWRIRGPAVDYNVVWLDEDTAIE